MPNKAQNEPKSVALSSYICDESGLHLLLQRWYMMGKSKLVLITVMHKGRKVQNPWNLKQISWAFKIGQRGPVSKTHLCIPICQ